MNDIVLKHRISFALALIVGVIYLLPNIFFMNTRGYAGIPMTGTDAEVYYHSKINGVYKDCYLDCNPYIKEYGNKYPFFDVSIQEPLLAMPGILLGIPVEKLDLVYDFLLPVVLTILVYSFLFRLCKRKSISLIGAGLVLLGPNLINSSILLNIPDLIELIKGETSYTQFLTYSRPVNPQLSSIYFFVFLHVLLSAMQIENKAWYIVLLVTFGISFYIYFFTYAFATAVLGAMVLYFIVVKKWRKAVSYIAVILGGFVIAIPQIAEILSLMSHPFYKTIPTEYLIKTHIPDVSISGIIFFVLFITTAILYVKKEREVSPQALMLFILIFSIFITRNEHVISGMIMQYNHFQQYIFDPIVIIAVCFVLHWILRNRFEEKKWITVSVLVIVVTNSILIQINSYEHHVSSSLINQRHVGVLSWLRENAENESIIMVSEPLGSFVTMYTSHYITWSDYAGQFISIPGRKEEAESAFNNANNLINVAKKYGATYVVEKKKNAVLKGKKPMYEDGDYLVYEVESG